MTIKKQLKVATKRLNWIEENLAAQRERVKELRSKDPECRALPRAMNKRDFLVEALKVQKVRVRELTKALEAANDQSGSKRSTQAA